MNEKVRLEVNGGGDIKVRGDKVGRERTYCRYRRLLLCTSWLLIAG